MAAFETPLSAAVSSTIGGVFGLAGKVVEAAGNAVRGVGEAVGGALEGALSPTPVTVVNAVGMAGNAGKSNVTGSGTIPAPPKKTAKPVVNANMPTEKLLVVAVNYLASIESTLAAQINADRQIAQQQATAAKEAAIEGSDKAGTFSNLGERLGAIKDRTKDRASTAGKLLIGAGLLGALGLGALGSLDTKQLDELKSNWASFTEKFGWVYNVAKSLVDALGPDRLTGALAGGYILGWRGALGGLILGHLYERAEGKYNKDTQTREGGVGWAQAILENVPLVGLAIAPKTTLKYAWRGIKTGASMLWNAAKNSSVGRFVSRTAGAVTDFVKRQARRLISFVTEGRFYKMLKALVRQGRMWQLFKKFLQRFAPRLFARLAGLAAAEAAATTVEVAVAATGVGAPVAAVIAIVEKVIAVGFAAWLLYDLYQMFKGFWETPDAKAQDAADEESESARPAASPANTGSNSPSGTPSGSPTASSNASPDASSTAGSNAPDTAYDIVLGYGRYGKPEDYYNGRKLTQLTVAEVIEFGRNVLQPRSRADGVGRSTSGELLGDSGVGAYATNRTTIQGAVDNGIITPNELYDRDAQDRVARWLYKTRQGSLNTTWAYFGKTGQRSSSMTFEQAQPYIMAGEGTAGRLNNMPTAPDGGSSSALGAAASAAGDLAAGAIKAVAGIAQVGLGAQRKNQTTGSSLTQGMTPPVSPVPANDNRASEIEDASRRVETAVQLGDQKAAAADIKNSDTPAQASLRKASDDNKIEVIDPNYPGIRGSIIDGYLQYYKKAS
jgi:hypothetical protein